MCLTRDVQTSLSLSMDTSVSKVAHISPAPRAERRSAVAKSTPSITKSPCCLSAVLFNSQVKTPMVGTKSKVLVPGLPGHQAPVKANTQGSEKRKKDSGNKEVSGSAPLLRHLVTAIKIQITLYFHCIVICSNSDNDIKVNVLKVTGLKFHRLL